MGTPITSVPSGGYKRKRFAGVLSELHQERERRQQYLADLNEAISCFETLKNYGLRPKRRPRVLAKKMEATHPQPVQRIS